MIHEKIDLYEYLNLQKPNGAKGYLTVYCIDQPTEIDTNRTRSAMLIIPGGGYTFVSAREGESVALAYLNHGINCFILDYSVYPNCYYPTQIREASMAMIFIRENCKKYHIDPETVGAVGFSAGGHLCGCLGNMFASEVLADLRNSDFIRPSAVVLSYPVTNYDIPSRTHIGSFNALSYNNDELAKTLSLCDMVNKKSSPAFIWHTVTDAAVPVCGSIELARVYNEMQIPLEVHLFAQGPHGTSVATKEVGSDFPKLAGWVNLSVNWLEGVGFKIFS
ncbi:MAG: alpha/beta hydrolase [Clostridia bacterium]|nr:alpha/beta hydrolase [Clostridia bacterium]